MTLAPFTLHASAELPDRAAVNLHVDDVAELLIHPARNLPLALGELRAVLALMTDADHGLGVRSTVPSLPRLASLPTSGVVAGMK